MAARIESTLRVYEIADGPHRYWYAEPSAADAAQRHVEIWYTQHRRVMAHEPRAIELDRDRPLPVVDPQPDEWPAARWVDLCGRGFLGCTDTGSKGA